MFEIHDEQENLRNDLALSVFVLDLICGLRSYVVCTYSYTVTKAGRHPPSSLHVGLRLSDERVHACMFCTS